jgi:hypothetical protein
METFTRILISNFLNVLISNFFLNNYFCTARASRHCAELNGILFSMKKRDTTKQKRHFHKRVPFLCPRLEVVKYPYVPKGTVSLELCARIAP